MWGCTPTYGCASASLILSCNGFTNSWLNLLHFDYASGDKVKGLANLFTQTVLLILHLFRTINYSAWKKGQARTPWKNVLDIVQKFWAPLRKVFAPHDVPSWF